MDEKIADYIVDLVQATREPDAYGLADARAADRVRRLAAGDDLPGGLRARARLPARPRLRARPKTSRRSAPTSCATASSPATRPRRRRSPRTTSSRASSRPWTSRDAAPPAAPRRDLSPRAVAARRRGARQRPERHGGRRPTRGPAPGPADRAAHPRLGQLALQRRVPLGVQGPGDGVRRGARLQARRRRAHHRLERHRAHRPARTSRSTSRSASSRCCSPWTSPAPSSSARAGASRRELAAEIAAVLALSAVRNNDRVGLLVFTDHVEHFVPPKKGRRHVLRLIRDVLAFRPRGRGTELARRAGLRRPRAASPRRRSSS